MMKGGFYGLRAKQLVLVLAAVAFTAIFFFGWAKTPIIFSMVPPQSSILNVAPDEIKEKKNYDGENAYEGVNATVAIVSPLNTTITNTFRSENEKNNSLASLGTIEDEITKKQVPEGKNSSGVSMGAVTVAPVNSTIFKPFTSENEEKNSTASVETMEETITEKEVSVIKQVSKGENKSEHAVHESVVPVDPVSTNLSLPEIENLKTPVKVQACNYAKGKWITDDNRPLYSGFGCKQWLSGMWACRLTQRIDFEYEKLRWKPKDCEMEDFTGSKFLRRMRNKTLAFIGDSLGRQQFQSLMCMVTGGEERLDVVDVGWEYGLVKARGHVRPDGWVYRFPRTNTTILYYWSASLCDLEPLDITNPSTDFAMHLDRPPAFLRNFIHKFDVLVLNTGHHWNRGKLNANRWVMYVGGKPNTDIKIADIAGAKNFTIYSIVNWVNSELPKYPGLKAFYRSISPRHFFNGDWNTGGTCDNTTPRSGELEVLQEESIDPLAASLVNGTRVKLLDITALSQLRDEGHISRYSLKSTPGVQDCLHWCLPGVPDTWNELLFAHL